MSTPNYYNDSSSYPRDNTASDVSSTSSTNSSSTSGFASPPSNVVSTNNLSPPSPSLPSFKKQVSSPSVLTGMVGSGTTQTQQHLNSPSSSSLPSSSQLLQSSFARMGQYSPPIIMNNDLIS